MFETNDCIGLFTAIGKQTKTELLFDMASQCLRSDPERKHHGGDNNQADEDGGDSDGHGHGESLNHGQ